MKNKKFFFYFVFFFISLFIYANSLDNIIKVGFFKFTGYNNKNENGELYGYGYEQLNMMSYYLNNEFEYIGYDKSIEKHYEMLDSGEIDILPFVHWSAEKSNKYLFSKPIGYSTVIITIKSDNKTIIPQNYNTYNGKSVGIIKGTEHHKYFDTFAKTHKINYTPIFFSTEENLAIGLESGVVDMIVSENARLLKNEIIIESFHQEPFFIIAKPENFSLINNINKSLDTIDASNSTWRNDLFNKFFGYSNKPSTVLTFEELSFLEEIRKSKKPLKVITNPDRHPYSYYEQNQTHGIFIDIFKEIAKELNLNYEIENLRNRNEYLLAVQNRTADIILDFTDDYYKAESLNYNISAPYITSAYVAVQRTNNTKKIKTIAGLDDSIYLLDYVTKNFAGAQVLYFQSVDECINAVKNHLVDMAITFTYTAQEYMRTDVKNELTFNLLPRGTANFCIATKKEHGYLLHSVLNKTASSFEESKIPNIIIKKTSQSSGKTSIISILHSHPLILFLLGFIFFGLIFIFLMIINKRKTQMLQEKVKHQRITEALSYGYISYHIIDWYSGECFEYHINEEIVRPFLEKMVEAKYYTKSIKEIYAPIFDPKYRDLYLEQLDIETVRSELMKKRQYIVTITQKYAGGEQNLQLIFTSIDTDQRKAFIVSSRDISATLNKEHKLQEELSNALEQANSANNAKSSFLFNMSHDIRTPMNAILGYTDLTITNSNDKNLVEYYMSKLQKASNHLLSLINDILDMARIENGKMNIEEELYNIKVRIDECLDILLLSAQEKDIKLTTSIDIEHFDLYYDGTRMRQIIINILGNAIKYTPKGGNVHFSLKELPCDKKNYGLYIISIKDNGIGISEEFQQKIFNTFTREHSSTTTGIQGTGLGLAITKNLVEAMGGTIEVKSQLGVGSEFIVKIPLRYEEATNEINTIESNRQINYNFQGLKTLLVEDNDLNIEIASEILKSNGFIVDVATNGQLALDMIAEKEKEDSFYDLILMDIQMPVLNGYDTTKIIRKNKNPKISSLKIIAMTANAFEEDKQNALEAGMNAHISKPINMKTMLKTIGAIL